MGDMDLSLEDLWKMIGCVGDAFGNVKSKACKKDCMKGLESCSTCVYSKTECLSGGNHTLSG